MAMLVNAGRQYEFENECVLGRHRECGFVVHDGGASRRHSRVFQADGSWWVEDLGSANGTRHNGERFEGRRKLVSGDAIRIGDAEIMFFAPEAAVESKKTMIDPASLEGREIAGHRIGAIIGRGGMGFIYRARQLSLDRDVAFKVFTRQVVADDPGFPQRFAELAGKAGSLRHDGFVQIHETGTDDGLVWYTMDLVEGDTVERLLERETRFDPVLALIIAERMAAALAVAHAAGVVHRDLSPSALILTAEGKVKILDVGIAAVLGRGRDRTRPRAAWYQSPEQADRLDPHPADDAYALGCMLYHMLVGRPPFDGNTLDAVRTQHREAEIPSIRKSVPGLPARIDEVVQPLLTKNRDWRHTDMAALAGELRTLRDQVGAKSNSAAGYAERIVHARKPAQAEELRARLIKWSVVFLLVVVAIILAPMFLSRTTVDSTIPVAPPVKTVPTFAPPKQPFGQTPPPPVPVSTEPGAPAVDWSARLKSAREASVHASRNGDWNAADTPWAELAAEAGLPAATGEQVRLARGQLAADADAWYQRQVAALPTGDETQASAARLAALSRLRDAAPVASRPDAEARWLEARTLLQQQLADASRRARQALEQGRPEELPRIADALAPVVAGTPLAGLHRQFADLVAEAARVRSLWSKDWATTVSTFDRLRGEKLLPAAAALLVAGDTARAKRMLADPALNSGTLLRRREAILGRSAALLTFDDPGDLRFVEVLAGEPTLAGGALAGKAGDPAALTCTVPVGGDEWQAETAFNLAGANGELVFSCNAAGEQPLLVRVGAGEVLLRVRGGNERKLALTTAGLHRLRASCRGGELLVVIDGQTLLSLDKSPVPAGCQAKLELAGADWRLDDLIVIGGG